MDAIQSVMDGEKKPELFLLIITNIGEAGSKTRLSGRATLQIALLYAIIFEAKAPTP